MSKENRGLLINFGILLILSLGFLIGYNVFYTGQDQKKYQTYFAESTGYKSVSVDSTILSKKYEITKGSETLGYHFIGGELVSGIPGTEDKKEFRVSVIVDKNGKVINIEVDYSEHTESFVEKVLPFFGNLVNQNIVDYLNVDDVGGASQYTMPVVHKVLSAITLNLGKTVTPETPKDPYILVFGEYASKVTDDTFVPNAVVLSREIIYNASNQPIGIAYVGTGTESNIPHHDGPAKIDLLVGFSLEGKIIGTTMLVSEHTPNYVDELDAQIAGLVGQSASEMSFDVVAGSTLSSNVVKSIIEGIKSVYKGFDLYSLVGLEYETAVDDPTFVANSIVLEKKVLKDALGVTVGYVFTGFKGTKDIPYHDDEAALKLMVGMDVNKVVTGVYVLENDHTPDYFKMNAGFIQGLTNVNIDDFLTVDSVTGASISLTVIKDILSAVKNSAAGVEPEPVDPYTLVFGEYDHKAIDPNFVADALVIKKEFIYNNLNQVVGIAYVGTKTITGIPGHLTPSKLDFLVGLDLEGKILGTNILEHEHTQGFVNKLDPYFASLVNTAIADYETVDLVAGASLYTMPVIQAILAQVKLVHQPFDVYSLVGPTFITKEVDGAFIATDVLLEKQILKDTGGNVVGYVMIGTDGISGIPSHGDTKEYIKLAIGMDENMIITGVYLVESNHTQRFVAKIIPYLNDLVGFNINSFEDVDAVGGASTYTMPVITAILTAMKGAA